jgi:hypothetical protein
MEVIPTSLTTALSLFLNIIYKQPILAAIHRINLLVTVLDFHLVPALYLVNTTYKDEVPAYNYP